MAFLVKMLVHLEVLCRDGISHYSSYNIVFDYMFTYIPVLSTIY